MLNFNHVFHQINYTKNPAIKAGLIATALVLDVSRATPNMRASEQMNHRRSLDGSTSCPTCKNTRYRSRYTYELGCRRGNNSALNDRKQDCALQCIGRFCYKTSRQTHPTRRGCTFHSLYTNTYCSLHSFRRRLENRNVHQYKCILAYQNNVT